MIGLARLRTYLDSVGSPKWVLQELRDQLTEAERELPRADPAQRPRIEQDIEDLRRRIADQERLVADPRPRHGAPRSGSAPGWSSSGSPSGRRCRRPGRSS